MFAVGDLIICRWTLVGRVKSSESQMFLDKCRELTNKILIIYSQICAKNVLR